LQRPAFKFCFSQAAGFSDKVQQPISWWSKIFQVNITAVTILKAVLQKTE